MPISSSRLSVYRWFLAFCKLLLCSHLCFGVLPLFAGSNLLKDSSFEGPGNNFWGFFGSRFTEADFSIDSVHGRYSLRWPHINPLADWPYDQPITGLNQGDLYHQAVSAVPERQYTLSAWAKTDADSLFTGSLRFVVYDSDRAIRLNVLVTGPLMTLTRQWQRYSHSFTLPAAQNSKYVVSISFGVEAGDALPYPNPPRTHGLVDAVQFEEAPLSAYHTLHPVEYGFLPQASAHAFQWGEEVRIDLYACNTSESNIAKTVSYKVEDFYGRIVRSSALDLTLPSKTRVKNLLSLGTDMRGHFRILLEEDGVIRTEKVFSTIPVHKNVPAQDSLYGADAPFSDFMLETVKRLGMNWLRPHADLSWENMEPQPGQFDFPDYRVQLVRSKGLSLYGFLYRTPGWARPPGGDNTSMPSSLAAWSNFVYHAVNHYRGQVDYWEIYNEPCFQLTSTQYLALVQTASAAAKAANPSAAVFGWSGQVPNPTNYCYADVKDQLVAAMGLLSAHYYPDYLGVAGTGLYNTLVNHRQIIGEGRLPLWNTESGASGGGTFYRTRSDFDPSDARNTQTADLAKTWAIHKAADVRMFYYWMNFPNGDHTPAWSYSWTLNEYDSSLKAGAVATAASAYFLDGADVTFQQFVYDGARTNEFVTAYGFKRGLQDHIVVAWLDGANRTVNLNNPSLPAATRVYDMFGRLLLAFAPGESFNLPLNSTLVYIEVLGYPGIVDRNFLRLGAVVPDNNVPIQETLNPNGGPTLIQIFGSDQNPPSTNELIYQTTITQPAELSLPWDAPVVRPTADTLVLFHMDNRSEYGETATSLYDFSGAGRKGRLLSASGTTLSYGDTYGKLGGGLRSPGGQFNRAIVVTNGGAFNGLDQFTVSFWARLGLQANAHRLFALGNVSGFSPGTAAISARTRETGSEMIFQVADESGSAQRWSSSPFPKGDGLFHHLTFAFDGRAADPNLRRLDIYLDGTKVDGALASGTIPARTKSVNAEDLYIVGHGAGGPAEAITGDIDEFVFEKRALSDTEVMARASLNLSQNYYWFIRSSGTTTTNSPVHIQPAGNPNTLTYTISATGQNASVVLSPQQPTYSQNQEVTIAAVPSAGYSFVGWTGSLISTNNSLVVTMNSDLSLLASVTQAPVTNRFLNIVRTDTHVAVSWDAEGVLQCAPGVAGPYTNVVDATSPYSAPIADGLRFYRLRLP